MHVRTNALKAVALAVAESQASGGLPMAGVRVERDRLEATNGRTILRYQLPEGAEPLSEEPLIVSSESITGALRDPLPKRQGVVEIKGGAPPTFKGAAGAVPMAVLAGDWLRGGAAEYIPAVAACPHVVDFSPEQLELIAKAALLMQREDCTVAVRFSFQAKADGSIDHGKAVRIDAGPLLTGAVMLMVQP
jgi:hypothetical protein